jgi:hypothetical protein
MTYEQGVRIACRYVVVFLLIAAIGEVISLPSAILNLRYELHHAALESVTMADIDSPPVHFLRSAILAFCALMLRLALNLAAAMWFYRCGPRLQRFFGATTEADASESPLG